MKFLVFALIFIFVVAFFACVFLFPEWVGIAGQKAKEIEDSHAEKADEKAGQGDT